MIDAQKSRRCCSARTTSRAAVAAAWLIVAAVAVAACSSDDGSGRGYLGGEAGVAQCPQISGDCPTTTPSYTTDVAPILEAHCVGCHGPGGENSDVLLDSYAACTVAKRRTTVPNLVTNCLMPPPPLPPLTADEITTLQCWFPLIHPPN